MLSQLPKPKVPKLKTKINPNHTLIGIIIILVLIVGVIGGYILFSHSQTPVITSNISNNTTADNTTSTVDNQPIVKKAPNSPKSNPNSNKKE
jgi:flagellar basal body-associated protein FliL